MSVLQTPDREPSFRPTDLPRARTWSGSVARVWAHVWGQVSREEHDAAVEIVIKHFDGSDLHQQILEKRVAQAYEGLTGVKPNIGILVCDRKNLAIIGFGIAFTDGKTFLSQRSISVIKPKGKRK